MGRPKPGGLREGACSLAPSNKEPFMRQAAELVQSTPAVEAAVKAAELLTDLVEEEGEATLFTFDDDSVMVVQGDQMNAYDDIAAARQALGC